MREPDPDKYPVGSFVRVKLTNILQFNGALARIAKPRHWVSGEVFEHYVYELDLIWTIDGKTFFPLKVYEYQLEPAEETNAWLNQKTTWDKCPWKPAEKSNT